MKPKPNLTFVIETLGGGGAERVMLNLMNYLAEQGYTIDLVLVRQVGVFLDELSPEIQIHDMGCKNVYLSLFPLIRFFRQHKPSIIISSLNVMNAVTLLARHFSGINAKTIIRVDNFVSKEEGHILKQLLHPVIFRRILPLADEIVIVSKAAAADLSHYSGIPQERITTIYNPVLTDEISQKMEEKPNHPWLLQKDIPVLVAIGRLTNVKNFTWLIETFHALLKYVEARLLIFGQGEDQEKLERLIRKYRLIDKVQMPGFVQNPYAVLKNASIFVLTSKHEGLPTVMIEALACNCPVVSIDCQSGPAEILNYGGFGWLVDEGNKEGFILAIRKVLGGDTKPIPGKWLEQFSLDYAAERYKQLFQ